MRYGEVPPARLAWLREHSTTEIEVNEDSAWKFPVHLHGYHWFSEYNADRETVEANNAHALVPFAGNVPVMTVQSEYIPYHKAGHLGAVSARVPQDYFTNKVCSLKNFCHPNYVTHMVSFWKQTTDDIFDAGYTNFLYCC